MKKPVILTALVLLTVTPICTLSASAKWGKFTITDDNGEQVVVKHGLFGKKTVVKDRWGDGFEHKKSIFGLTKDTEVSALGNDVHVHKGLFGFGKTEGQDMLGDTVTSNKNLLYRNTNVNLSGFNNLVDKYLGPKKPPNAPPDPGLLKPNTIEPAQNFNANPTADANGITPFTPPQN